MNRNYFLGIDGGGTKSRCLLEFEDGRTIVLQGGPMNICSVSMDAVAENLAQLFRQAEEGEVNFIRFRDIPAEPCELIPLNFYISQKPDIHFRHILRVNQRKEGGVVYSLVDHELTIHSPGGNTVIPVPDRKALDTVLANYFGIDPKRLNIQKDY